METVFSNYSMITTTFLLLVLIEAVTVIAWVSLVYGINNAIEWDKKVHRIKTQSDNTEKVKTRRVKKINNDSLKLTFIPLVFFIVSVIVQSLFVNVAKSVGVMNESVGFLKIIGISFIPIVILAFAGVLLKILVEAYGEFKVAKSSDRKLKFFVFISGLFIIINLLGGLSILSLLLMLI